MTWKPFAIKLVNPLFEITCMEHLHSYLVELEIARRYLGFELAYLCFSVWDAQDCEFVEKQARLLIKKFALFLKVKWPRYVTVTINIPRPMFIRYIVFKRVQYIAAWKTLLYSCSHSGR